MLRSGLREGNLVVATTALAVAQLGATSRAARYAETWRSIAADHVAVDDLLSARACALRAEIYEAIAAGDLIQGQLSESAIREMDEARAAREAIDRFIGEVARA